MKKRALFFTFRFAICSLTAAVTATAQDRISPGKDGPNVSLKLEIQRAIDKGSAYLKSTQNKETGTWSDPTLPALTALPVSAILGDPSLKQEDGLPPEVEKAYEYIVSNARADGGIYGKGLATYNTSLSMMALMQSGKKEHLPIIAKARRLLINQQQDHDQRGEVDNLYDGGIGYGGSYAHSDLSNTHLALEALHYSKKVLADTEFDESSEIELDWDAAIEFISAAQNSDNTVKRLGDWATVREEDQGGFVYFPGSTKSDVLKVQTEDGEKTALRSYGSMGYAGLLAFIYADMDRDDPRITAVMKWLQANFSLEENPGLDAEGLYYYYHTMAKALVITGTEKLIDPEGNEIHWKNELALKIMGTQETDGSWINEGSNRWMEDDRALVTAYSLLSLERIYRAL